MSKRKGEFKFRSIVEALVGVVLTVVVVGMCYVQLYHSDKKMPPEYWQAFTVGGLEATSERLLSESIANFGQWLSGVAGALAFVWLIVAYLQQGRELKALAEETNELVETNAGQQHAMNIQLFLARFGVEASATAAFVGLVARRVWAGKMEEYLSGIGGGSRDLHFVLFAAVVDHPNVKEVLDQATRSRLAAMCDEFDAILAQVQQLEVWQSERWQLSDVPTAKVRDSVECSAWALTYWTACRLLDRQCMLRREIGEKDVKLILK